MNFREREKERKYNVKEISKNLNICSLSMRGREIKKSRAVSTLTLLH